MRRLPPITLERGDLPERIQAATLTFHFTSEHLASADWSIYQEILSDDDAQDVFRKGLFAFDRQSVSEKVTISRECNDTSCIIKVSHGDIHVNLLIGLVNEMLWTHETPQSGIDELIELEIDTSQFASAGEAVNRIKSIELSEIIGGGKSVNTHHLQTLTFAPRTEFPYQFVYEDDDRNFVPLEEVNFNEAHDGSRIVLSGFDVSVSRDLLETFEDSEQTNLFSDEILKREGSDDLIEVFSRTNQAGSTEIVIDNLECKIYAAVEFANLLQSKTDQSIQICLEQ